MNKFSRSLVQNDPNCFEKRLTLFGCKQPDDESDWETSFGSC